MFGLISYFSPFKGTTNDEEEPRPPKITPGADVDSERTSPAEDEKADKTSDRDEESETESEAEYNDLPLQPILDGPEQSKVNQKLHDDYYQKYPDAPRFKKWDDVIVVTKPGQMYSEFNGFQGTVHTRFRASYEGHVVLLNDPQQNMLQLFPWKMVHKQPASTVHDKEPASTVPDETKGDKNANTEERRPVTLQVETVDSTSLSDASSNDNTNENGEELAPQESDEDDDKEYLLKTHNIAFEKVSQEKSTEVHNYHFKYYLGQPDAPRFKRHDKILVTITSGEWHKYNGWEGVVLSGFHASWAGHASIITDPSNAENRVFIRLLPWHMKLHQQCGAASGLNIVSPPQESSGKKENTNKEHPECQEHQGDSLPADETDPLESSGKNKNTNKEHPEHQEKKGHSPPADERDPLEQSRIPDPAEARHDQVIDKSEFLRPPRIIRQEQAKVDQSWFDEQCDGDNPPIFHPHDTVVVSSKGAQDGTNAMYDGWEGRVLTEFIPTWGGHVVLVTNPVDPWPQQIQILPWFLKLKHRVPSEPSNPVITIDTSDSEPEEDSTIILTPELIRRYSKSMSKTKLTTKLITSARKRHLDTNEYCNTRDFQEHWKSNGGKDKLMKILLESANITADELKTRCVLRFVAAVLHEGDVLVPQEWTTNHDSVATEESFLPWVVDQFENFMKANYPPTTNQQTQASVTTTNQVSQTSILHTNRAAQTDNNYSPDRPGVTSASRPKQNSTSLPKQNSASLPTGNRNSAQDLNPLKRKLSLDYSENSDLTNKKVRFSDGVGGPLTDAAHPHNPKYSQQEQNPAGKMVDPTIVAESIHYQPGMPLEDPLAKMPPLGPDKDEPNWYCVHPHLSVNLNQLDGKDAFDALNKIMDSDSDSFANRKDMLNTYCSWSGKWTYEDMFRMAFADMYRVCNVTLPKDITKVTCFGHAVHRQYEGPFLNGLVVRLIVHMRFGGYPNLKSKGPTLMDREYISQQFFDEVAMPFIEMVLVYCNPKKKMTYGKITKVVVGNWHSNILDKVKERGIFSAQRVMEDYTVLLGQNDKLCCSGLIFEYAIVCDKWVKGLEQAIKHQGKFITRKESNMYPAIWARRTRYDN